MNPLTALCFLVCTALYCMLLKRKTSGSKTLFYAGASLVLFAGAARLLAHLTPFDAKLDQILFASQLEATFEILPNRMAPNTAIAFVFLSLSLMLHGSRNKKAANLGQCAATVTLAISIVAAIVYFYGISSFYGVSIFIPMALHTAVCFLSLSLSIMLLPKHGCLLHAGNKFFWKLCAGYFCIILITTLIIGALIAKQLESAMTREAIKQLEAENAGQIENVSKWFKTSHEPSQAPDLKGAGIRGIRLSVLDKFGKLVLDNSRNEQGANYSDRPEIVSAQQAGSAWSKRLESDNKNPALFFATRIDDKGETIGYLHSSIPVQAVMQTYEDIRSTIVFGAFLATAVALLVGIFFARRVTRPLTDLTASAIAIAYDSSNLPSVNRSKDEIGQLSRAFRRMALKLKGRIEELEDSRRSSEKANQAKSSFVANVSHEIRTPLNGIIGILRILGKTPLNLNQQRHLNMAQTSAKNLITLMGDILDFSKLEAEKVELEELEFDILAEIDEALNLCGAKALEKKLSLSFFHSADLPNRVKGDPSKLRQIVTNLLSNAVKFTESGGVSVQVSLGPEVGEQISILIKITDTGIGIPASRMDRLFSSFSQVDASTTRSYGGTGLGLAISKQLTELLGGTIGVESVEGKGSTFSTCLPFDRKSSYVSSTTIDNSLKVLIIDQSLSAAASLKTIFEESGFSAIITQSREKALELFEQNEISSNSFVAVVVDSALPEWDRIPHDIKDIYKTQTPSCILHAPISAETENINPESLGFSGIILKPVRRTHLFDNVILASSHETRKRILGTEGKEEAIPQIGQGKNVLLAEDNEINRVVADEVLKSMGFEVDMVTDGSQAANAASSKKYDLIIMDCQMPVMDGYEATAQIRKQEIGTKSAVPIIALTANVATGEAENCLESGMNAYCTKPVEVEKLLAVLSPFIKEQAASPVNMEELSKRCLGKEDIVKRVLSSLAEELMSGVGNVKKLADEQNFPRLVKAAHNLRGTASTAAAQRFYDMALELEEAARKSDHLNIQKAISSLDSEGERIADFIKSHLA